MTTEELDPFKGIRNELIEGYKSKIKGISPLIYKAMVSAYSDGVNSMIKWIHDVEARSEYFDQMKKDFEKKDDVKVKSP